MKVGPLPPYRGGGVLFFPMSSTLFSMPANPFGTATASNSLLSADPVTPVHIQAADAKANPFLSGLGNLFGGVLGAAGNVLSKATESFAEQAGSALAGKVVGSVAPTGSVSPEVVAAQQRAEAARFGSMHSAYPQWLMPAAAAAGALLIAVMLFNRKD